MKSVSLIAGACALALGGLAATTSSAQDSYDNGYGHYGQSYSPPQYARPDYSQDYSGPSDSSAAAQAQQNYDQRQQDYQDQRQQYNNAYSTYQGQQDHYYAQQNAYHHRRAHYDRERAAYDAQYGAGAFMAYYRDHPSEYDARYGAGAFARDFAYSRHAWNDDDQ